MNQQHPSLKVTSVDNDKLTDLALAVHQLRTTGLTANRPDLAILRLSGSDSRDFLQRIVAGNLDDLRTNRAIYTALLTPKSTVISPMTVIAIGPNMTSSEMITIDLLLPTPLIDSVKAHFDRLIFSEDIVISQPSVSIISAYGQTVHGDFETNLDSTHLSQLKHGDSEPTGATPVSHCWETTNAPSSATTEPVRSYLADHRCGVPGVIIWSNNDNFLADIPGTYHFPRAPLKSTSAEIPIQAYDIARIEAGVPAYPNELNGERLILEAGQRAAVSLNKGCYAGQEPVCRIASRGKMQWYLSQLISTDPFHATDKLTHPKKEIAAIVTSACYSPTLQRYMGLAYVHRKALDGPLMRIDKDTSINDTEISSQKKPTNQTSNIAPIEIVPPGSLLPENAQQLPCPQRIQFP